MVASPTTAGTNVAALGLLIFDGDCGFCTKAARRFGDFAGNSAVVQPWQALNLDDYGLTEDDVSTSVYWVQDGVHHAGADAVVHGLQACKMPWPLVGKLMGLPPFLWIARGIYPVIAKYRYRLPGSTDACRIG